MPSATGHRCFSADSSPIHRRSIAALGGVDADSARRRSGCSLQVEKWSQAGDMAMMCQEVSFPQRLEVIPEESACPPHRRGCKRFIINGFQLVSRPSFRGSCVGIGSVAEGTADASWRFKGLEGGA